MRPNFTTLGNYQRAFDVNVALTLIPEDVNGVFKRDRFGPPTPQELQGFQEGIIRAKVWVQDRSSTPESHLQLIFIKFGMDFGSILNQSESQEALESLVSWGFGGMDPEKDDTIGTFIPPPKGPLKDGGMFLWVIQGIIIYLRSLEFTLTTAFFKLKPIVDRITRLFDDPELLMMGEGGMLWRAIFSWYAITGTTLSRYSKTQMGIHNSTLVERVLSAHLALVLKGGDNPSAQQRIAEECGKHLRDLRTMMSKGQAKRFFSEEKNDSGEIPLLFLLKHLKRIDNSPLPPGTSEYFKTSILPQLIAYTFEGRRFRDSWSLDGGLSLSELLLGRFPDLDGQPDRSVENLVQRMKAITPGMQGEDLKDSEVRVSEELIDTAIAVLNKEIIIDPKKIALLDEHKKEFMELSEKALKDLINVIFSRDEILPPKVEEEGEEEEESEESEEEESEEESDEADL